MLSQELTMPQAARLTAVPAADLRLPREAELILTAMDAAKSGTERRAVRRTPVKTKAMLRLFIDQPGREPRVVYSRDVHARGLGFITQDRLPLGYGGVIDLVTTDGSILSIACTLLRCRPTLTGWYEGVLHFNRDQTGIEALVATARPE